MALPLTHLNTTTLFMTWGALNREFFEWVGGFDPGLGRGALGLSDEVLLEPPDPVQRGRHTVCNRGRRQAPFRSQTTGARRLDPPRQNIRKFRMPISFITGTEDQSRCSLFVELKGKSLSVETDIRGRRTAKARKTDWYALSKAQTIRNASSLRPVHPRSSSGQPRATAIGGTPPTLNKQDIVKCNYHL
jgi:hypothetical protein